MAPVWVDSHFHLDSFAEAGEVEGLLERAVDAGVTRMVAIGGRDASNTLVCDTVVAHPGTVFGAVGFDRDLAGKGADTALLQEQLQQPGMVAVGESGLDYHYQPETAPEQRALFGSMLEIAAGVKKPIVIHSRDAEEDTLGLLSDYASAWSGPAHALGVLHCFTGSVSFARSLLDLGLYISFSGIVTFRNAEALREVARYVPMDRMLVETDAPYLAPVPHRGKTNEPAWVSHVGDCIAAERELAVQEVAEHTSANASRLFGGWGASGG